MPPESPSTLGILCALNGELGSLASRRVSEREVRGFAVLELDLEGRRALAVVSGVGKVRAAHAASVLLSAGVDRALLVVGTCGALAATLRIGEFVHATSALDFQGGSRHDRESASDPELRGAWSTVVGGKSARFFTVDRAVTSPWSRFVIARSRSGPATVDMETAAAALVADAAGIPWAALRVVTDRAGFGAGKAFKRHFSTHGGRAAESVPDLARTLR